MLLLRTPAIRRLEARHQASAQPGLMEQAGRAAADLAGELIGEQGGRILVVAGAGNNGGDAYVCARHLKSRGHAVLVVSTVPVAAQTLPADALAARQAWLDAGGEIVAALPARKDFALAIDGLFGIGLTRAVEGLAAEWIDWLNGLPCPILALDVPSGLDADSGAVRGHCVRAAHTLTFIAAKPGLYTLDGRDHAGTVHVATLGIDAREEAAGEGRLISSSDFESALRRRPHASHKGSNGNAVIVGGAPGMAGAPLLAGRAALYLGAGRVYVGMLDAVAVDHGQPELMLRGAEAALEQANQSSAAIGIGPGLGSSEAALTALKHAIHSDKPLVLDADALNLLAVHPVLAARVARRPVAIATVLTPHPREAARLLECRTEDIQADRIGAAQKLAQRFNAAVVLKGSGSVVAAPDGRWYVNGNGNPGLATAGTGDVLLGIVTAFIAQRGAASRDAVTALLAAVHLHAAAADRLAEMGHGPVGLSAGELLAPARLLWNRWIAEQAQ